MGNKTIEIKFNNGDMIIKAENKSFQLNNVKTFQTFGTYASSEKSQLLEFDYDSKEKIEKDKDNLKLLSKLTNSEEEYFAPSKWEEEQEEAKEEGKKKDLEWSYTILVRGDYKFIIE